MRLPIILRCERGSLRPTEVRFRIATHPTTGRRAEHYDFRHDGINLGSPMYSGKRMRASSSPSMSPSRRPSTADGRFYRHVIRLSPKVRGGAHYLAQLRTDQGGAVETRPA